MSEWTSDEELPLARLPARPPGGGIRLLQGVRVLDLTTSIAGPYATMLLSDFGAEIVKIERPGKGDDSRAWGPPFLKGGSLWHASVNRNKKSVALDYRAGPGRAAFEELVRSSDVLVTNQLPEVREKVGSGYETLRAINPRLVYVSLTGFGTTGERSRLPSYDIIAEGYSGVMDVTGEADSPPQKIGTPAADLLAGHDAAMAALAALFEARASGRGHYVDISMVESMTRLMTPRIAVYLGSGEVPRRTGAKDSVVAVYQTFETADGMLTLALPNDNIWHRFWAEVGAPEFGARPEYATSALRQAHRAEIVAEIERLLRADTRDSWLRRLGEQRIPCGPINRVDELVRDDALIARGLFFAAEGTAGPVPQVGLGIHVDGEDAGYRSAPPELGEHTEAVLREIAGCDDVALERLRAAGAI